MEQGRGEARERCAISVAIDLAPLAGLLDSPLQELIRAANAFIEECAHALIDGRDAK
jgi:hypothetical protein